MDEKQRIIQEIIRVSSAISPQKITKKAFLAQSDVPWTTLRYHFGTWNRALMAAAIAPNPQFIRVSGYERIPEDDLLHEIGRLWVETGGRPTESLANSQGRYSVKPYRDRWGTFSAAVDEYIAKHGTPPTITRVPELAAHPTPCPKAVVLPPTYKPSGPPGKAARPLFGEPLNFRGLRHAPLNEQGVVYLFGMVSMDLGFLIEIIRSDFPDCEGKRALDPTGTRWEHVRIEFEYKSTNFREHAHDPNKCDLIVCWVHDWENCPIEVLELKTVVAQLSKAAG